MDYYEVKTLDKIHILESLLPEDVEEIISLYLQFEKNYLIYTSTNKIDTPKYEFVMTSRDGSHLCYAQVKTGFESLDGEDFKHLVNGKNKVYLFAVSENYSNVDGVNIIGLKKKDIVDFVYRNRGIMPKRIRMWL